MNDSHTASKGFTLVELAIALMVIGLLIGGVLKGQELINNARITAYARQVKAYEAAIMIFKNTYGALPGDIKKPNRIPNCTTAICNLPGNGNSRLADTSDTQHEMFNFFPHLTKAGMITGPEGGVQAQMTVAQSDSQTPEYDLFFPTFPIGRTNHFDSSVLYIIMQLYDFAKIDQKLDDGHPQRGDIREEDCAVLDNDGDGVYEEYDTSVADYECGGWLAFESIPYRWWN